MRNVFSVTIAALLLSSSAVAQTGLSLPSGAEAMEAKLLAPVGPQTRRWIRQEAAREHAAGTISEVTAKQAIASNQLLGQLSDSDIMAVAFLVMMEASKSAREDVKAIMAGVKQINDAKASLRQNAQQVKSAKANSGAALSRATTHPLLSTNANRSAIQARPISKSQFDRQLQIAKNDPNTLSEMGQIESLRLQMSMDRISKVNSMLSNLLKKLSDSGATITQNLK